MEQPLRPKPSVAIVVLSVVVLAACLVLISAAFALFAVTWDPCSLFGGVILLLLPSALAIQQYRGTFRCDSKAAVISSVFLFIVGGHALLAVAVTLGTMIVEGSQFPWMSLLLPMLAIGAFSGASGWMNLAWSKRLKRFAVNRASAQELARFTMRELFVAIAAIACVTALATHFVRSTPPQYAENVIREKAPFGLPPEATGISFCKGARGTIAYEFTIDESGFVAWVDAGIGSSGSKAAGVSLQPIATPYSITRYYALTDELKGPDSIPITNGLYYEWSEEDRGVFAAFDRKTGRAYYYAHFH